MMMLMDDAGMMIDDGMMMTDDVARMQKVSEHLYEFAFDLDVDLILATGDFYKTCVCGMKNPDGAGNGLDIGADRKDALNVADAGSSTAEDVHILLLEISLPFGQDSVENLSD